MFGWFRRVASCASSTNIERKRRERRVRRQDALDDEELVRALGAALLGEEHLGHAARAEPAHDLELRDLVGNAGGSRRESFSTEAELGAGDDCNSGS